MLFLRLCSGSVFPHEIDHALWVQHLAELAVFTLYDRCDCCATRIGNCFEFLDDAVREHHSRPVYGSFNLTTLIPTSIQMPDCQRSRYTTHYN